MGIFDSKGNYFFIVKQILRMFICYNLFYIKRWLENYIRQIYSFFFNLENLCVVISDLKIIIDLYNCI